MNGTIAYTACLAFALASGSAIAQAGGVRQPSDSGLRVQIQETTQRETPTNDFASLMEQEQARRDSLSSSIAVLGDLIDSPQPAGLSRRESSAWREQSEWLTQVRQRYRSFAERLSSNASSVSASSGQARLSEMTQMNMEFLSLQNEIQMESRKFQTLSNAMKSRHDAAMNAIRNMK